MTRLLAQISLSASLRQVIRSLACTFPTLEVAEFAALNSGIVTHLSRNRHWSEFREIVSNSILSNGYIVVRGLEPDGGRSLIIAGFATGWIFETYHSDRIVKRFSMSPWTTELSHTTRAGDFHTDGNVAAIPPVGTAIQCENADPGEPEYAEQRVAHLPDLLERLASGSSLDSEALQFLTREEVIMAHERTNHEWTGRLVQNGTIRYHPHSLCIANKRHKNPWPQLPRILASIHAAALDVSVPFHTNPGDAVFVSNKSALHYRGECSVRFTDFPTKFDSRSVFVLHFRRILDL